MTSMNFSRVIISFTTFNGQKMECHHGSLEKLTDECAHVITIDGEARTIALASVGVEAELRLVGIGFVEDEDEYHRIVTAMQIALYKRRLQEIAQEARTEMLKLLDHVPLVEAEVVDDFTVVLRN